MQEQELINKVAQKLESFDELRIGNLSTHWEEGLIRKINQSKHVSKTSSPRFKLAVVILIFFSLNIEFALHVVSKHQSKPGKQSNELQVISNELLINPIP